jgi:hypothetical protein
MQGNAGPAGDHFFLRPVRLHWPRRNAGGDYDLPNLVSSMTKMEPGLGGWEIEGLLALFALGFGIEL